MGRLIMPATQHTICLPEYNSPIAIAIKTHARSKRVTLRMDPKNQQVTLTKPPYVSVKKALEYVEEKKEWIAQYAYILMPISANTHHNTIPILGKEYTLCPSEKGTSAWTYNNTLYVGGRKELHHTRILRFLKQRAKETLTSKAQYYANKLNVHYNKITLRDTTSRWGSCSAQGNLSFCWRLIMAPEYVLNYVVAHEICHLKEMNHSPAFWNLVASLEPDYPNAKHWLKNHGHTLHQRF